MAARHDIAATMMTVKVAIMRTPRNVRISLFRDMPIA